VMFFMGAIAGMLNVWRVFTGRGLAAGYFDEHKNSSGKDALLSPEDLKLSVKKATNLYGLW